MAIDLGQLITDIKTASSNILNSDITTLRGFADDQLTEIAHQAAFVAIGIETKQISPDLQDFFLFSLEDMVTNFVQTLRGLTIITMEKIWNSVVNVIWSTISKAVGIPLIAPVLK